MVFCLFRKWIECAIDQSLVYSNLCQRNFPKIREPSYMNFALCQDQFCCNNLRNFPQEEDHWTFACLLETIAGVSDPDRINYHVPSLFPPQVLCSPTKGALLTVTSQDLRGNWCCWRCQGMLHNTTLSFIRIGNNGIRRWQCTENWVISEIFARLFSILWRVFKIKTLWGANRIPPEENPFFYRSRVEMLVFHQSQVRKNQEECGYIH